MNDNIFPENYRCNCGRITGKQNEFTKCDKCKTEVRFHALSNEEEVDTSIGGMKKAFDTAFDTTITSAKHHNYSKDAARIILEITKKMYNPFKKHDYIAIDFNSMIEFESGVESVYIRILKDVIQNPEMIEYIDAGLVTLGYYISVISDLGNNINFMRLKINKSVDNENRLFDNDNLIDEMKRAMHEMIMRKHGFVYP